MIKINDLRIGNYIQFGILNIVKVESINPKTLIAKAEDSVSGKDEIWDMVSFSGDTAIGSSRIEGFIPIPLTEEILLKCGFNYDESLDEYEISDDDYCILIRYDTDTEEFYYEIGDLGYNYIMMTIKYVHQLQNLIFALTGQELEINL